MARKVKGMVHLEGVTYRIVRVVSGSYSVIRITDDEEVGAFKISPTLSVDARGITADLLRDVALLAIHTAKTSCVSLPIPASSSSPAPAESTSSARNTPSSLPPPIPAT